MQSLMILLNIPNISSIVYFFSIIFYRKKKMVPTVKKNYSIFARFFVKNVLDDFLFSPFTKNFASVINKKMKRFLYQTV